MEGGREGESGGGGGGTFALVFLTSNIFQPKKMKKKLMLNNTAQFLALQYFAGHFVVREFILVLFNVSFCESSFFFFFVVKK